MSNLPNLFRELSDNSRDDIFPASQLIRESGFSDYVQMQNPRLYLASQDDLKKFSNRHGNQKIEERIHNVQAIHQPLELAVTGLRISARNHALENKLAIMLQESDEIGLIKYALRARVSSKPQRDFTNNVTLGFLRSDNVTPESMAMLRDVQQQLPDTLKFNPARFVSDNKSAPAIAEAS